MKIVSWNVNGIRSAERKGFLTWLTMTRPDVLGLQETRIDDVPVDPLTFEARGYATC